MKASNYNIFTTIPDNSKSILFNTLYGTTSIIEPDEWSIVQGILKNPHQELELPSDDQIKKLLLKGQYLIDDGVDEIEVLKNRKMMGIADPNRFDVIIMPNLDCNFACPYCYESHCHSNRMSNETQAAIIKWIANNIANYKVMLLSWFGGEPTLSPNVISNIGGKAQKMAKEHGVKLLAHMTTNGYALTGKSIEEFTQAGILSYQITVDGPQEIHDRTRILTSGKGSFQRVRANIVRLAEYDRRIKISLRVNYNQHNINFIPELLDVFPSAIRSQLRVVYEPIFGESSISATENMSHSEISAAINDYYDLAESLGYDVSLGSIGVGKLVYCYAERANQYIVNFNGDVFKCSVMDFDPSTRVGRIDADGQFVTAPGWSDWFNMELFDIKCESCSFLPLCMGGCRKDRVANGATGSYCNLVPSNTSQSLKSIAFGQFDEYLKSKLNLPFGVNDQREHIIASG